MDLEIHNVQILPCRPQNGLVAFATVNISDCFYLGNLAVITSPGSPLGYRIQFPTKKLANGKHVNCFYPYKKEVEEVITRAIVKEYVRLMDDFGHSKSGER